MIIGYVNKQSLRIGQNLVVTGTIDYLEAEFHFTEDWTGMQKWAHFICGDKDYQIPLDDDRITKDKHLNLTTGTWTVWLHGDLLHNGMVAQRVTTDQQTITVKNTGMINGEPFPEVPASALEQVFALADHAQKTANAAEEKVETAERKAEKAMNAVENLSEYTKEKIEEINRKSIKLQDNILVFE